jgi:putative ATP-binding cassette transporter
MESRVVRRFLQDTISVLSLYWKGEEKVFAWCALAGVILLSLLAVGTALITNEWYKHFYNAIQAMDVQRFYYLMSLFGAIVVFSVVRSVLISYLVDLFSLRWRRWLTHYYLSMWAIKSEHVGGIEICIDNPDQRVAEDIKRFTFETIDLACGLTYTLTSIVSFSVVLISISGDASFYGVHVPAYMFWAALLYALLGTYVCQKIGSKLVFLSNFQQQSEADFRYSLMKFRDCENEQLATERRQHDKGVVSEKLDASLINMRHMIMVKLRLSLFVEIYKKLSLVFSSLLAVPSFFSGNIMFGDVMQINSAFGNLCQNLSWFINAYHRLADWKATTNRLLSFAAALAPVSLSNAPAARCQPLRDTF